MWKFIIIFLLLIIVLVLFYLYNQEKNKNKDIAIINQKIQQENEQIEKENAQLLEKKNDIQNNIEEKQKVLHEIQEISRKAFEQYADSLEKEYEEKEQEYAQSIKLLNQSYDNIQSNILAEIDTIHKDLDNISATRAAAIQAQLEEEKIQQQAEYYSLYIADIDKREIKILQSIEKELRDPRPIRMVIWQTYYSKKANELASRVLGPNDKCGIYKITNKDNKLCYIGQARNIRERFREHMKCGLGIDTPSANKLYQAMLKDGIDNFTFELLEECAAANLNEKEVFYINLYNSYDYGYNSNRGNKNS